MLKVLFFIFAIIFTNFAMAKKIDDALNEVLTTNVAKNRLEACEFQEGDVAKFGVSHKNAKIQITNKIAGKTEFFNVEMSKPLAYNNLEISLSKCCSDCCDDVKREQYAFFKISNTKSKKEVFKGWMLSHAPSLNPFEDSKFDVVLVSCF
jgi:hypothetical protein